MSLLSSSPCVWPFSCHFMLRSKGGLLYWRWSLTLSSWLYFYFYKFRFVGLMICTGSLPFFTLVNIPSWFTAVLFACRWNSLVGDPENTSSPCDEVRAASHNRRSVSRIMGGAIVRSTPYELSAFTVGTQRWIYLWENEFRHPTFSTERGTSRHKTRITRPDLREEVVQLKRFEEKVV